MLWLMEEEALQPGASEETLLGRLFSYYGPAEGESKGEENTNTCTVNSNTKHGKHSTLKKCEHDYLMQV